MKICIINGPNINFLGKREKNIYGTMDYNDFKDYLNDIAKKNNIDISIFQSNIEGEIIDKIQEVFLNNFDGIIINPGAYTHYSYAIMDGLKSVDIPIVEVHFSNIHKREDFRHKSVTASACIGQISGFGHIGYEMAINYLIKAKELK